MLFVQFPWPLLAIIEILTKDLHLFSPYNMFRRLAPCSKCISYPFGVRQSMVGEGCDEAGVHHPERISHALWHFPFSFSLLFAAIIVCANIIRTINSKAIAIFANAVFTIIIHHANILLAINILHNKYSLQSIFSTINMLHNQYS